MKSICFRIGFCGVAVALAFLRLFLSSYYNSEVNIIMKKITALLLALFVLVGALAGCGKQNDTNKTDKLSIVTTIFPEYDWVREILGDKADNAEITMLLDNGVDLHSYQPTADDIVKISDCDLFIYVGGESDGWVEDALRNAANRNMKVINLLEILGDSVKTEEIVEGMQEEHEHEDAHAHDDAEEHTYNEYRMSHRSRCTWNRAGTSP